MTSTTELKQQQDQFWNGEMGETWVAAQDLIEVLLQPFEALLVEEAVNARPKAVLDVGCGNGPTTRALSHALGSEVACTGIDLSGPMIENAKARAQAEGLSIDFIRDDASEYVFGRQTFDFVTSRFGAMFFAEPKKAFANLRRAALPGARLRMIVWGSPEANDFMTLAPKVAAQHLPSLPPTDPHAPGPFSLSNPSRVSTVFSAAGWAGIQTEALTVPCGFPASELDHFVEKLAPTGHDLAAYDPQTANTVSAAIREAFNAYIEGDDVRFDAHVLLVRARAN